MRGRAYTVCGTSVIGSNRGILSLEPTSSGIIVLICSLSIGADDDDGFNLPVGLALGEQGVAGSSVPTVARPVGGHDGVSNTNCQDAFITLPSISLILMQDAFNIGGGLWSWRAQGWSDCFVAQNGNVLQWLLTTAVPAGIQWKYTCTFYEIEA